MPSRPRKKPRPKRPRAALVAAEKGVKSAQDTLAKIFEKTDGWKKSG